MRKPDLRPATGEERQLALLWFAAVASALILRPVWLIVVRWLRPCSFRDLTGIPCPTCGTTRTALALLNGDVWTAFAVNPLAAIVGIVFVIGGISALVWVLLRGPVPVVPRLRSRWWFAMLAAAGLINWAYLIITD